MTCPLWSFFRNHIAPAIPWMIAGLAGLVIVSLGEPRTDSFRLRVKGDTPFDDACLTSALRLNYPDVVASRGGPPYHLLSASVSPPSAPSELARISIGVNKGELDLSAEWSPMDRAAPAFEEALARDVANLTDHAARACGVQRWSTHCRRPAPHAPCPQLSPR